MNTDRLLRQVVDQKQARTEGLTAVFGSQAVPAPAADAEPEETGPKPRGRKPMATSKRQSWKMRAWFVKPETARRLKIYVNRRQENGDEIDASDVVEAALSAWLDQNMPPKESQ